jgi:hypothetical protein
MPETTADRDRPDADERPSPGASNPGEPGYEGDVTVGDDGYEASATAEAVDEMDERVGLEDPEPVIEGDPEPSGSASANPADTEGESPSG